MDVPETSIQVGRDDALRRKTDAIVSGLVVDIGGVSTFLQASDVRRADAIANLLADAPAHSAPPEATVRFDAEPVHAPARAPDVGFSGLDFWQTGSVILVRDGSGILARVDERSVRVGGDAEELRGPFTHLFQAGLSYVLARRDRFLVHGGAILTEGGRAVLLVGESGVGKSTVTATAFHSGWQVVCDDLLVIRSDKNGPWVMGIPRPIAIPADVARTIGIDSPATVRRARVELPRGMLRSGWWPIAAVIEVAHGADPGGGIRPVAGADAVHTFVSSFIPSHDPALLRRFFPTAAVLSRLPTWELQLDPDPVRRVGAAAKLLDSVRGRLGPAPT